MLESLPRVVLLDLTCPEPYDSETANERAIGGTEATVARVAEGLAASGKFEVIVAQHNRKTHSNRGKAIYCPVDDLAAIHKDPHSVIALRTPKGIPWVRNQWSNSRTFLWCHDENYQDLVNHHDLLAEAKCHLLGVSRYHKQKIQDAFLSRLGKFPAVTVDFVYNPVSDALIKDETPWSPDTFLYFSSPHKGLGLTLEQFALIKRSIPEAVLKVANPGYYEHPELTQPGVEVLGKLSHPDVIRQVRAAFCVLHLNVEAPETFGIVHAEANAVGTPVLTAGLGANREVLSPPKEQVIDCRNIEALVERILFWRKQGRPEVGLKTEFRQSEVIKAWERILR
jgi:glycosyltransferase involved in cell wall biosynthesis